MVDLKSNEHTTEQEIVSKRRTGKDSNESFNVFRGVTKSKLADEYRMYCRFLQTRGRSLHKEATRTSGLGKNDRDTTPGG